MPSRTKTVRPSATVIDGASRRYGYAGEVPDEAYEVVEEAWRGPFAFASNFARARALGVALAASLGWISIVRPDGRTLSARWHLTASGLTALEAFHTLT